MNVAVREEGKEKKKHSIYTAVVTTGLLRVHM